MMNDKDRVRNINTQINQQQINGTIVPAQDGKTLDITKWIEKGVFCNQSVYSLSEGQIGCALSHILLWEKFLNSNKPYLIVMEDDVVLVNNFNYKLNRFIKYLPNDYDIAYIFIHDYYIHLSNKNYRKKRYHEYKKASNINPYVKKVFPMIGCVAYMLSRKGAKKLLDYCTKLIKPIDNMIENYPYPINVYSSNIKLVDIPYSLKSNIWTTTSKPDS